MTPQTKRGDDNFQTPENALLPLLPFLPQGATVWECACGKGNLVNGFVKHHFNVVATDLHENKYSRLWCFKNNFFKPKTMQDATAAFAAKNQYKFDVLADAGVPLDVINILLTHLLLPALDYLVRLLTQPRKSSEQPICTAEQTVANIKTLIHNPNMTDAERMAIISWFVERV